MNIIFFCYLPIVTSGAMTRIKAEMDGINKSVYSSCNRVNTIYSEEIEDKPFEHFITWTS